MTNANPHDIAYISGYMDGTQTVAKLTVRIHVLKCMLLVSATVILYLLRSKTR